MMVMSLVGKVWANTRSGSVAMEKANSIANAHRFNLPCANLTIFAFSDACDYLTGETIAMDGGQRLAGPNTFAGLTAMTDQDWAEARERSEAASAAAKAARSV